MVARFGVRAIAVRVLENRLRGAARLLDGLPPRAVVGREGGVDPPEPRTAQQAVPLPDARVQRNGRGAHRVAAGDQPGVLRQHHAQRPGHFAPVLRPLVERPDAGVDVFVPLVMEGVEAGAPGGLAVRVPRLERLARRSVEVALAPERVGEGSALVAERRVAREAEPSSELIFASQRGTLIRREYLSNFLMRCGVPAVPHGFRSTFRDWCAETGVSREVAEICLAHAMGPAYEAAYSRTDMLERRRAVMDAWAEYIEKAVQRAESNGDLAPWVCRIGVGKGMSATSR